MKSYDNYGEYKSLFLWHDNMQFDASSGTGWKDVIDKCDAMNETAESLFRRRCNVIKYTLENSLLGAAEDDIFPIDLQNWGMSTRYRDLYFKHIEQTEMKELLDKHKTFQENLHYTGYNDFSHTTPDWQFLLDKGIIGIKNIFDAKRNENDFYACVSDVYASAIVFIKRVSDFLRKNGHIYEADSVMALTERAPQTMLEALETIMIFFEMQSNVECSYVRTFGCLDQILYGFYKHDASLGVTEEEIRRLLRAFLCKLEAQRVSANQPFALGCIDENGNGYVNELSYIILDEFIKLEPTYTKVHIRTDVSLPEKFIKICLDSIRTTSNSFVFINNSVASAALTRNGCTEEDARDYGIVGCYEICAKNELPCSCNGRVNIPKAIEAVIQRKQGYESFECFLLDVKAEIKKYIDAVVEITNKYESYYEFAHFSPFISSTYVSCIESGRDCYYGGAKYGSSSINAIGIATAADSLIAIKRLVFEDKTVSFTKLADILAADWADNERLRLYAEKKLPKYGNNDEETDMLARDILQFVSDNINGRPNGHFGTYRMGSFSIDWRMAFGEKTGATPDGRKAGTPLSKNVCASTARDINGATAHILSATRLNYFDMPNGTVLDLALHHSAVSGDEGLDAIYASLCTFLERDGFAIQYNVLNPQTLREAQKNPEKYSTLQVRLCGWNTLFNDLSREDQDEFIKESEALAQ